MPIMNMKSKKKKQETKEEDEARTLINKVKRFVSQQFPDGCPGLTTGKRHIECMALAGCRYAATTGSGAHSFRVRMKINIDLEPMKAWCLTYPYNFRMVHELWKWYRVKYKEVNEHEPTMGRFLDDLTKAAEFTANMPNFPLRSALQQVAGL